LRSANVIILSDEAEFGRLMSACWQAERTPPDITILSTDLWREHQTASVDLVVIGPIREGTLSFLLRSIDPAVAVIHCSTADAGEYLQLRRNYPRLVHVPLREDWAQTLLLVAGESLRKAEALKRARRAERKAAKNQSDATLGRYMLEMNQSVNNALTSLLGNAELLLLEPGQLSSQSLAQIKTIHSMAKRINQIMLRFSSLASEMRGAETASQAETEQASAGPFRQT
jgi:signal transduction histidine kinase